MCVYVSVCVCVCVYMCRSCGVEKDCCFVGLLRFVYSTFSFFILKKCVPPILCSLSLCLSFSLYRVPLGFVCGYPLSHRRTGGEQYGGSLFARSAASDTLQGQAIQRVNQTWGEDPLGRATGRETIGITVCKKKYKPFLFPIVPVKRARRSSVSGGDTTLQEQQQQQQQEQQEGPVEVQVIRMFGCKCHHPLRKAVIERHGLRQGWEPFGQWSLRKAQDMARRETIRLNSQLEAGNSEPVVAASSNNTNKNKNKKGSVNKRNNKSGRVCKVAKLPAAKDDDDSSTSSSSASGTDDDDDEAHAHHRSHHLQARLCLNGSCTWKLKSAYDDIFKEIHGYTESEAEDNNHA